MILKKMAVIGIPAVALALGASGVARADNLVSNGDFSSYTTDGNPNNTPGYIGLNTTVADWATGNYAGGAGPGVNLLFLPGTADTTGSYYGPTGYYGPYFTLWGSNNGGLDTIPASSPAGGNFIAADGDPQYSAPIFQTVGGLTAGQTYTLGFYWAAGQESNFDGATTEQWQVSLGGETQSTVVVDNASHGFVPWMYQTMTFTATSSSEVLSFLAIGSPENLPPMLLLNDVHAQQRRAGAECLGAHGRRPARPRRRQAAPASQIHRGLIDLIEPCA